LKKLQNIPATFVILKAAKSKNNHPSGENSPYLVTLVLEKSFRIAPINT
jgi:hypothetical protein